MVRMVSRVAIERMMALEEGEVGVLLGEGESMAQAGEDESVAYAVAIPTDYSGLLDLHYADERVSLWPRRLRRVVGWFRIREESCWLDAHDLCQQEAMAAHYGSSLILVLDPNLSLLLGEIALKAFEISHLRQPSFAVEYRWAMTPARYHRDYLPHRHAYHEVFLEGRDELVPILTGGRKVAIAKYLTTLTQWDPTQRP